MAEEKLNPAVETEKEQEAKDNASNPEQESGKTVSIAEMQRRLKQAEDKHQLELANLQADVQKQIEDAVAKAKMSDEELEALKERQDAIKAIEEENATLKAQIAHRNMQDLAIKELEKQGVPVNESTLAFVVKDDEEATKLAVTNMANILNIKKREEAKSNPPKTSGGSDGGSKRGKDKFASAKITNF